MVGFVTNGTIQTDRERRRLAKKKGRRFKTLTARKRAWHRIFLEAQRRKDEEGDQALYRACEMWAYWRMASWYEVWATYRRWKTGWVCVTLP